MKGTKVITMEKTNKQKLHSCIFRKSCLKSCFDCKKCEDWKHDKKVKIKEVD